MEGFNTPRPEKPRTVPELYQAEAAENLQTLLSEAAKLELEFMHGESSGEFGSEELTEMAIRAGALADTLSKRRTEITQPEMGILTDSLIQQLGKYEKKYRPPILH